jgi:anthranilate synthase component 1
MVFGLSAQETITLPERRLKIQKFKYSNNPLQVFQALSAESDHCYLLESAEGPRKLAQYSFIGFSPTKVLAAKHHTYYEYSGNGKIISLQTKDPLSYLRRNLEQISSYSGFRFVGGLVGYLSYDTSRYLESLPELVDDDLKLPDFQFGKFDDGIVFDHLTGLAYYYWYDDNRIREIKRLLSVNSVIPKLSATSCKVNLPRSEFASKVKKAKAYIKAGDIFQVVLSKRFEFDIDGSLIHFYKKLRDINPSPYMYFLKMGKISLVGSSPEMLGRVEGRQIETYPIAGTRPIGMNSKETEQLAASLIKDPKERAEHVMLVDLARNDVGKVCQYGSVDVPDFMTVQRYSHVQHIVSRVVGKLEPDKDAIDAIKAIFPAGTVSGAPKKRAMEIIEELEPCRRGPYAGALGYFSYNGNADFAITIRTLLARERNAYLQVGAGIVADSDAGREWEETEHKAGALLRALEIEG